MAKPRVTAAATATPPARPPLATHTNEDSIANLRRLSDAFSGFSRCFSKIQQHINSVQTSIASIKFPPNTTNNTTTRSMVSSPPSAVAAPTVEPLLEPDPSVQTSIMLPPDTNIIIPLMTSSPPAPAIEPSLEPEPTNTTPHLMRSPPPAVAALSPALEHSFESDPSEDEEEEVAESKEGEVEVLEEHEEGEEHKEVEDEVEEDEDEEEVEEDEAEEEVEEEEGEKGKEEEVKSPRCSEVKSYRRLTDLERLCKEMSSQGLRRYVTSRISNMEGLCQLLPKALKLAPDPASLVLQCLGKIYCDGKKSYVTDSNKALARSARVVVLECFLLMGIDKGVVEIHKRVKQEAEQAALDWRKRIIAEGGIGNTHEMDARGLLLHIGCFGIPYRFTNEDIKDLLQVSCIKRISAALRRSNVLMAKIPELIESMVKDKMEVDAVYVAYTFGIEDRFNPQSLLTSFLLESAESMQKMIEKSQGSLAAVNEAKRKHLSAMTSVVTCLGRHEIDPSTLLPGWQITSKITRLVKELAVGERQAQKRKIDETEPSGRRLCNKEAKTTEFPNPLPHQQRVVNHGDSNNTLLEGASAGRIYGSTLSPLVLHGPVVGSQNENGSLAGTMRSVAMGGVGAGISAVGANGVPLAGSYAVAHGGTLVDSMPGQLGNHTGQLYGLHGDAAVYGRPASHDYAYRPSSYLEGSKGLPNIQPSDAYRPPSYLEGSNGLQNTQPSNAYRSPQYVEGSTGLLTTIHNYSYRPSSSGLPSTQPRDAYKPPAYSEGSSGLPNTIPHAAYMPPPHLEGSTGVPNSLPGYRPSSYSECSTGLPNTIPHAAYRSPQHLAGSTGVPNALPVYRPPSYSECSTGLPNTIPHAAYRPPPHLEGSTGVPNALPVYRPPPYSECSTGLPNTMPHAAYRPPPHLEGSTGVPNALPVYRPPPYSECSTGLPNTMPHAAYRPPPHLEGSTGVPNALPVYRPPPYSECSTGLPNTVPVDTAQQSSVPSDTPRRSSVPSDTAHRGTASQRSTASDIIRLK